ncbi:MAG: DUF192 domain-containing protein [Rhodothermales bacterium]|nr:DUF192 domain-containing protein [Rhodothermales bacterium]
MMSVAILSGCNRPGETPTPDAIVTIPFTKHGDLDFVRGTETLSTIEIEIADSDSSRLRGLMQRTSLPENSGMLFIFPVEEEQGFWMGNTQMSLDLIYVSADSSIVSIAKYAQPMALETIPSGAPAQYVVEVPAGYTDSYGIIEGDMIVWRRAGQ